MQYWERSKRDGSAFFKVLVLVLILLGITFIVIPSIRNCLDNTQKMKFRREIQNESEIILTTAQRVLNIRDLESLGVKRTIALTPDVFNNLSVAKVVKYLSMKRLLNSNEADIITKDNPNIKLGDLKVIINEKSKNITVDSNGNLAKLPNI